MERQNSTLRTDQGTSEVGDGLRGQNLHIPCLRGNLQCLRIIYLLLLTNAYCIYKMIEIWTALSSTFLPRIHFSNNKSFSGERGLICNLKRSRWLKPRTRMLLANKTTVSSNHPRSDSCRPLFFGFDLDSICVQRFRDVENREDIADVQEQRHLR